MQKSIIIAEIGINHNGSVDIAKQLILAAKNSGADLVKFQKRDIDSVYTKAELNKPRESPWGKTNREQKIGLEFNEEQYDEINDFCKRENVEWFVSCWDLNSVKFMNKYDLKYNKIASALLTHEKLLETIASQKKYTFISTGMSTLDEISKAVEVFKKHECPFELLHCNAQYPAPEKVLNLNVINTLKSLFKCEVGYSCHSTGIIPAVAAVAMGASSIEKHITLDRAMYGSDQSASVEPGGFLRMVDYIRTVEESLGDGIKHVTAEEEKCKAKLRREDDIEYN
jgi:N-acetylneuraminate synthase